MLAALSFGALSLNLGRFLLQTCCQPSGTSGMNNTDVTTEEPKGRISLDMGQEEKTNRIHAAHGKVCSMPHHSHAFPHVGHASAKLEEN